jgi:hypothetical protein
MNFKYIGQIDGGVRRKLPKLLEFSDGNASKNRVLVSKIPKQIILFSLAHIRPI